MKRNIRNAQDKGVSDSLAITAAEINRFRGFISVELDDIRRVNIVVGDNGSGKTAFLEALFLVACSSPQKILDIRQARALPMGGNTSSTRDSVWEWFSEDFFHDYDAARNITISIEGSENYQRSLRIFHQFRPTVVSLEGGKGVSRPIQSPISFEWKEYDENEGTIVTPHVDMNGALVIPNAPDPDIRCKIFRPGTITASNPEEFSDLRKAGKHLEILEEMKRQFPYIEDMSVEVERGNGMIFVKKKFEKRLVPINLLSDGLCKIFNVLLSFTTCGDHRSFILADELDNGIFFKRHELFWRQINDFSRKYNTQMFASIHSEEFLASVLPVAEEYPEDFSIIRIFQKENPQKKNQVSQATIVPGPKAISLIESGIEVR